MTTIAFDGRVLAADRLANVNGLKRTITKIWRIRGELVGSAGSSDTIQELLHWYAKGADPALFPASQRTSEWDGLLVIKPKGEIFRYERTPYPLRLHDEQVAIGSGRDFAIGAMAMGASAARAVEVARQFDPFTGQGLTMIRLNDPNPMPHHEFGSSTQF